MAIRRKREETHAFSSRRWRIDNMFGWRKRSNSVGSRRSVAISVSARFRPCVRSSSRLSHRNTLSGCTGRECTVQYNKHKVHTQEYAEKMRRGDSIVQENYLRGGALSVKILVRRSSKNTPEY